MVVIWNTATGDPTILIECHPDVVYSACWNWDGSKLLTTCKDKKIRIINPRTAAVEEVNFVHSLLKLLKRPPILKKTIIIIATIFRKQFVMKDLKLAAPSI